VAKWDVQPVEARNPEVGFLLGMLQEGTRKARRELGEVPDDLVIWQPYSNGHSIGAILIHLAACEAGWLHQVAAGQEVPDDLEAQMMGGVHIDQYDGLWPPPPAKPLSWYHAQQDEVRARTIALLREMPDSTLGREIVWNPGHFCTVRWILHHIIEHEAYHTGQMVLLALSRERLTAGR
jgi:uncharacterized damage-inducible protein DinB